MVISCDSHMVMVGGLWPIALFVCLFCLLILMFGFVIWVLVCLFVCDAEDLRLFGLFGVCIVFIWAGIGV